MNSDEPLRMMQKADRFVHFPPPRGAVSLFDVLGPLVVIMHKSLPLGLSARRPLFPMRRLCSGFTLVELLVVIAIIAVLAALAMPFVKGALERSQSARSISNLKQIGAAVIRYTTEYNGSFPYLNAAHDRTGFNTRYWPLELENTVLNHPRKHAHDGTKHKIFRDPTLPRSSTHVMSDYGGNPLVFLNAWASPTARPLRLLNVRSPSKTIMVCTAINPANGMGAWWLNYDYPTGGNSLAVADARLSGGQVGAVFVDGHVENIPGDKLRDDLDYRRALFDPLHTSP
jgi:prepilin-type N-terminal cleavage/methylation domain-containing protein/prepilin-type processing-associated H-X9-DG protein